MDKWPLGVFASIDAGLGVLANNGGITWTQGLLPTSPALNAFLGAAICFSRRRMPPPRRHFTKLEALRAIEKSPLRFTHSWDQVKEETRG